MQKFYDKLLLGFAALALALSAAWVFVLDNPAKAGASAVVAPGKDYQPIGMDAPEVKTEVWARPLAQKSGPEWIYDLFTPPEIYYDSATEKFTVTPPLSEDQRAALNALAEPPPEPPKEVYPVALARIKQDVFPLQLVGYDVARDGGIARATGLFENAAAGEFFRARLTSEGKISPASSARKMAELGFALDSFNVERIRIKSEGSMTLVDTIATAVVRTEATGVLTTLTNKTRLTQGAPFAVLKIAGREEPLELRAGANFDAGGLRFTLLAINADSVEIEQKSDDAEVPPVKKTLTPEEPAAPVPDPAAAPAPALDSAPAGTAPAP
jgi:hypothetical protein